MGCDIHLYFEQKIKDKWVPIEIDERLIPDDRNYALFGFLAGVRDYEIETQFKGRGIPEDTSMPENDTEDFFIGDHSLTYAYLDEILNAPWHEVDLQKCYFFIFCDYILPRLCNFYGYLQSGEEKNIRVIMGFDN